MGSNQEIERPQCKLGVLPSTAESTVNFRNSEQFATKFSPRHDEDLALPAPHKYYFPFSVKNCPLVFHLPRQEKHAIGKKSIDRVSQPGRNNPVNDRILINKSLAIVIRIRNRVGCELRIKSRR